MDSPSSLKMKSFFLAAMILMVSEYAASAEPLTLDRSVAMVLEYNPELQSASRDEDAAAGDIRQAGKFLNPEVEFETENLGAAVTTIKLSQPFELGGKRGARIGLARADSLIAVTEKALRRSALVAETHRRFYRAIGLKKQIEQLDSLVAFAEGIQKTIQQQVESGRTGRADLLRSAKDIVLLRIEREMLLREYENGVAALAALWGGGLDNLPQELSLESRPVPILRMVDSLKAVVACSPAYRRAAAEKEKAGARSDADRADGAPDLAVTGGYSRDAGQGENYYSFGAVIGVPLFNRNKDAVTAARHRVEAADRRMAAVQNDLSTRLTQRIREIERLHYKAGELRDKVIPQTTEVLAELGRFYAAGKSGYMDIISAQRELVEAWRDYLNTETEIRLAFADILELTGQP